MAIAAKEDLEIQHSDAINVFLNSKLNDLIYCELPEGFPDDEEHKIALLLKALYGLPISPKLWFDDLSSTPIDLGMEQSKEESCIFTYKDRTVLLYVDDILRCF